MAGVAENANPHRKQSQDDQQTAAQLKVNANWKHERAQQKEGSPAAAPFFVERHERLKQAQQHCEDTELNRMSVSGDVHGFIALQLAIRVQRAIDSSGVA